MRPTDATLRIAPARVARVLGILTAALALASVLSVWLGVGETKLNVDAERNIPTWFSSQLLCAAALLLVAIAAARRRMGDPHALAWAGLALAFLALSVDEAAALHEMTIGPVRRLVGGEGLLYHAWIVPAAGLLVVLGLVYLPFLRALPADSRTRFVAAGAVYVGGAMGMEALGGWYASAFGKAALPYAAFTTAEELMEMTGVVLFLRGLLLYVATEIPLLALAVQPRTAAAPGGHGD